MQPGVPRPPIADVNALSDGELYINLAVLLLDRGFAYARRDVGFYRAVSEQLRVVESEVARRVESFGPNGPGIDQIPDSHADDSFRSIARGLIEQLGMPSEASRQLWTDHVVSTFGWTARSTSFDAVRRYFQEMKDAGDEVESVDLLGVGSLPIDEAMNKVGRWLADYQFALVKRRSVLDPTNSISLERWIGLEWEDRYARIARGLPHDVPSREYSPPNDSMDEDQRREHRLFRSTTIGDSSMRYEEQRGGQHFFALNGRLEVAPDAPDCPELIGFLFTAEGAKQSLDVALARLMLREVDNPIDVVLQDLHEDADQGRPFYRPTAEELTRAVGENTIQPALRAMEEVRLLGLTRDIDEPKIDADSAKNAARPRRRTALHLTDPAADSPATDARLSAPSILGSTDPALAQPQEESVELGVDDAADNAPPTIDPSKNDPSPGLDKGI